MAWYGVSDYIPTGGPVGPSPTPGAIGGGWIDNNNVWSLDGANNIVSTNLSDPWISGVLLRPIGEATVDARIVAAITWSTTGSNYVAARITSPGSGFNGYIFTIPPNRIPAAFAFLNGALSTGVPLTITSGSLSGLTNGTKYVYDYSVVQTNPTTTTLTITVFAADGVTGIATMNGTDTTAALQNSNGRQGVFVFNGPTGTFGELKTFTDIVPANATGYTITLASSGRQGVPISGTVNLVGGTQLTSPLVVHIVDDAGFSTNVTIPSYSASVGFTYVTNSTSTRSVSYTHTGGNVAMTGDGSQTVTIAASVVIRPNDTLSCVLSPYNWSANSSVTGAMQTWNAGAYARFAATNCTGNLILMFDPASAGGCLYAYQWDNGPVSNPIGDPIPVNFQVSIAPPADSGTHVLWVYLYAIPQNPGRWAGTLFFGLQGLSLPVGGFQAVVGRQPKTALIYGDSITEGVYAKDGTTGIFYGYSFYLGQALFTRGFEYGIVACGFQGYTVSGSGSVPPVYTIANDPASSWNKVISSVTRLTDGAFTVAPTVIFDNFGVNDQVQGHNGSFLNPSLTAQITAFWRALRAAAPKALIIKSIPFTGYARNDILNAALIYNSPLSDSLFKLFDLNLDARTQQYGLNIANNVHPGIWGHANIGSLVTARVVSLYDTAVAAPTVGLVYYPFQG